MLQGHSAELQGLKDLMAQQDRDASASQALVDSLQKQLADLSSHLSSLTSNLEAAQQSHHNAVQVLLQL